MLYAKALREGLSDLPAADPEVRARIEAEAQELGWPALHARLAARRPRRRPRAWRPTTRSASSVRSKCSR